MAANKLIVLLCTLSFLHAPALAQDFSSEAACRPGDTDPRCAQRSDPDLDGDRKPYAGPPPKSPSGKGSGTGPPPPPNGQRITPKPVQPWRPPPPPTAAQIGKILNAPVPQLSFVDLDHVADNIRIIMQYHARSLSQFEQREMLDKLREVEVEMDYRSRNRPPPPPGPPPLPPPRY